MSTTATDIADAAGAVDLEQLTTMLGAASLGFGVAGMLAPVTLRRAYGMQDDPSEASLLYVGRMWGSRTAVIGALALAASSAEDRRRVSALAAGMNAFDALVAAGTTSLPTRTRVMGVLTSGFFAGLAAYATTLD